MKLDFTYVVRKSKIQIDMSTQSFTEEETKALNMLGEPIVNFQKVYPGGFTVSIANKKIRQNFRHVLVRIDGTTDIEKANEAGNQFLEDIKEYLGNMMEELMDKYNDQVFPPEHGTEVISDYRVVNTNHRHPHHSCFPFRPHF